MQNTLTPNGGKVTINGSTALTTSNGQIDVNGIVNATGFNLNGTPLNFTGLWTTNSDGILRIGPITIKARVRRPTIQFAPTRIKPVFNLENNSIESMSNQVKERPKSEFYIRKDSELPSGIDGEKIIQRVRN